ncbi:MAG: MFS transporter, partial [Alphaproteobacteria bacterium]|nr:MFS transporter [Alphaproteobacteria bacterium]
MSAGTSQGDSPEPRDSPEETGSVSGFAAYRYRDFRFFVAARLFNAIAHHMVLVAVGYQVYDQTGDAMNLAYIGLASFAPAFGFALVTGYVADRFDRRLVVALCYVMMTTAA